MDVYCLASSVLDTCGMTTYPGTNRPNMDYMYALTVSQSNKVRRQGNKRFDNK